MDRDTLGYFEEVLTQDVDGLKFASFPSVEVPDDEYKRVLNVKLEAITADISNIRHLMET